MKSSFRYFRPFDELQEIVRETYPADVYENFHFYYMDLISKHRYLKIICSRYKSEKNLFKQALQREKYLNEFEKSLSKKELFEEHIKNGKILMKMFGLINLDVDSFFIFARIFLDRIPYLLRPLYKGNITDKEVAIRDFKAHLDWFDKNSEDVLDSAFLSKMLSVRKWFYNKLRDPRNELIVHPEWDHIKGGIGIDGKVKRMRYVLRIDADKKIWDIDKYTELTDIATLFQKINDFLVFSNKYFCEKLSYSH